MLEPEKIAVIDVGSNSCRLVIYERAGAALLPYFNEKSTVGLGRGLPETGKLSPDGKKKALKTFHRFKAILSGLGVRKIYAVATAAVREADDGPVFREEVEHALGVSLRVLSGAEEGYFSALGVATGFRRAKGLVADLGGSSMELQRVGKGADQADGETYLLGPLARPDDQDLPIEKRRKVIGEILAVSGLLPLQSGWLFAVGGAWRNVAAVHMELTAYPLGVAHGYELDRQALSRVIKAANQADQDKDIRARLMRVSKRRYETLLHAALVLDCLMEIAEADTVHISAYGLREGLVVDAEQLAVEDGLLDTADLYFKLSDASLAFGDDLFRFVEPILGRVDQSKDVVRAICLMADAGARLHPDHRCQLVFEQVLRAPIPALTHEQRLFAAMTIAARYSFKFDAPSEVSTLMSAQFCAEAKLVGTAMRLGGVFSGRSARILKSACLSLDGDKLNLRVLEKNRDMVSSTVKRRLQQLANLLHVEGEAEVVASL